MIRVNRFVAWIAAVLAVGYLVTMFQAGTLPEYGHLNTFEAGGLMQEPPESVTQIELKRPTGHWVARKMGGQWMDEAGQVLPPVLAARLNEALGFMHTAAPVRTLEDSDLDLDDLTPFGLAPAALEFTLSNASGTLLRFDLGGPNPDGILRYVRATGQPGIVLVSGFVGLAWDDVATGLSDMSP